jgi:hypothetical protein
MGDKVSGVCSFDSMMTILYSFCSVISFIYSQHHLHSTRILEFTLVLFWRVYRCLIFMCILSGFDWSDAMDTQSISLILISSCVAHYSTSVLASCVFASTPISWSGNKHSGNSGLLCRIWAEFRPFRSGIDEQPRPDYHFFSHLKDVYQWITLVKVNVVSLHWCHTPVASHQQLVVPWWVRKHIIFLL